MSQKISKFLILTLAFASFIFLPSFSSAQATSYYYNWYLDTDTTGTKGPFTSLELCEQDASAGVSSGAYQSTDPCYTAATPLGLSSGNLTPNSADVIATGLIPNTAYRISIYWKNNPTDQGYSRKDVSFTANNSGTETASFSSIPPSISYDARLYKVSTGQVLKTTTFTTKALQISVTLRDLTATSSELIAGGLFPYGTDSYLFTVLVTSPGTASNTQKQTVTPSNSNIATATFSDLIPGVSYTLIISHGNQDDLKEFDFTKAFHGICGSANGQSFQTAPTGDTNLCSVGISDSMTEDIASWTWTCKIKDSNDSSTSQYCSATKAGNPPPPTPPTPPSSGGKGFVGALVPCGISENKLNTNAVTGAQTGGGVTQPCGFYDLLTLVNNVVRFIIFNLALPIAAIMFAYAGFLLITAGGESGQMTKAKGIFSAVVMGLIFVAAAWLIVKLILVVLGYKSDWITWFGF
ncbi:MAG: pilin [Patescibacteria group bacterium]